jgi:hypothetical protein
MMLGCLSLRYNLFIFCFCVVSMPTALYCCSYDLVFPFLANSPVDGNNNNGISSSKRLHAEVLLGILP